MEILTRIYKGKKTEFKIYTEEEAIRDGLEYHKDWTKCSAGDWGLTDDGYVIQCMKVKKSLYRGKERTYFTFSCAMACCVWKKGGGWSKSKIRWEARRDNRSFSSLSERTWQQREAALSSTKRAVDLYSQLMIAKRGKLTQADYDACGSLYRQDEKLPGATFKVLIKTAPVQRLIVDTMKEKLIEMGIDRTRIANMFLETYSKALEQGHTATMRGVANDLLQIFDSFQDGPKHSEEELDPSLLNSGADPTENAEWHFLDTSPGLLESSNTSL